MRFKLNYVELRRVFFGICIPVRIALALVIYTINEEAIECGEDCIGGYLVLRWFAGITTAVVVLNFIYADLKNNERGAFGGIVWWKNMRRVHMLAYFGAAMFIFFDKYGSHYFLFADAALAVLYAIARRVFIFYV